MQCPNPKCNQPNRAGAKFCTRCGMPFSLKGGAYTIIRPLGKGGMGAVYLAQQVIAKHPRPVVVKEMIPYWDPADPQGPQKAQQRFEDEAVTLVKLNHSGIPKIYDYFTEGGRNFIVMEYVEGRDLEQGLTHEDDARNIIPGKPYPPAQAARWAISLCRVLEYLATQSPVVIHHDIKPANIILDKNTGEARLVDFGTAKMKLAAGGQVGQQQSSVYGTQGYAPPEQYDLPGNPPRTEPRSDVYALAVTLYHLLTDDDPRPPHKPFDFPRLSSLSGTIRQTLATALEYDVNKRPTATQWRQQWEMLAAPQAASPFTFRSGDTAQTPAELVPLCDRHWDDGRGYLYGGQFERWFEGLNRHDLADKARDIRQRGGDQDAGLEEFLHELDPNLPPPNPQIAPQSLDFGALAEGQTKTLQLTVRNAGRGYARVDVRARERWLAADKTVVGVRAGQSAVVQVTADASQMPTQRQVRSAVECGVQTVQAAAQLSWWRTVWTRGVQTTVAGATSLARHPWLTLAGAVVLALLGYFVVWPWLNCRLFHNCILRGHAGRVNSVAFSPDGAVLASGGYDRTVKLWDTTTGQELRTLMGHSYGVTSVAFNPDSTMVASGARGLDNNIKLWDVTTGRELQTLTGHRDDVNSVTFSPDGATLASGSDDGMVRLWDTMTGQELRILRGHTYGVNSVAFSPNGATLASGSLDGTVKLWDPATGQEVRTLTGHKGNVTSVAFSPDGTILASGSRDGTVKLREAATGQELRTFTVHKRVTSVAFSPDGTTLASGEDAGGHKGATKLWDVATGREIRTFTGHMGWQGWLVNNIHCVAFSSDGTTLAVASIEVRLWGVK